MLLSGAGRVRAGLLVSLLAGSVSWTLAIGATPPLQKRALALGIPANDCSYCHVFDMEHMQKKAREIGISNMDCGACHGKKLPKTGRELLNERGKWLLDEKFRRHAVRVDPAWLRDYKAK